jgi:hypothetical protein
VRTFPALAFFSRKHAWISGHIGCPHQACGRQPRARVDFRKKPVSARTRFASATHTRGLQESAETPNIGGQVRHTRGFQASWRFPRPCVPSATRGFQE